MSTKAELAALAAAAISANFNVRKVQTGVTTFDMTEKEWAIAVKEPGKIRASAYGHETDADYEAEMRSLREMQRIREENGYFKS